MSDIQVGEYCRDDKGKIYKVTKWDVNSPLCLPRDWKHSLNIIDLIEVGDYVNGVLITGKEGTLLYTELKGIDRSGYHVPISQYGENIKSIVTKEQFAESEYKVNE